MLGARGRAGGASRLHGKAGNHQAADEAVQRLAIAAAASAPAGLPIHFRRRVCTICQARIDRLNAEFIGDDPIRARGDFCEEIGVAPGVHARRRRGDHIQIGQHRLRRGTIESLLRAATGD